LAEREVVFVDGMRTAFGRMGGTIMDIFASHLGGIGIKGLVEKTKINEKARVDCVFLGTATGCSHSGNPARWATLYSGLGYETTASYVEMQCGSAIDSINHAAWKILANHADIVIAGGMESYSQMAAKFSMPVLSMVDTPGAYPGAEAEERGQAEAIATNLFECSVLPVPIIVLILGEGGSGGALAIAVGDKILMMENSIYSVISPEGCASILWRNSAKNKEAAEALKITAADLIELGIIDEIVTEPVGGAHLNPEDTAKNIRQALVKNLDELTKIPIDKLIAQRINKFQNMGVYKE